MKEWTSTNQSYVRMGNNLRKSVGLVWMRFTLPLKNLYPGRQTEVKRNGSVSLSLARAAQKRGKFGLCISQGGQQATDLVRGNC